MGKTCGECRFNPAIDGDPEYCREGAAWGIDGMSLVSKGTPACPEFQPREDDDG